MTSRSDPPFSRPFGDPHNDLVHLLVESSPVAQLVVGADHCLAVANPRAMSLLELSSGDLGRPLAELAGGSDPQSDLVERVLGALERRERQTLHDISWRPPGRAPLRVDVILVPLAAAPGPVSGPLGTAITIVDRTREWELTTQLAAADLQLGTVRDELRSTLDELEATYEELQTTNERLETLDDERRSAAAELELLDEQVRARSSAVTRLEALLHSVVDVFDAAALVVEPDGRIDAWNRRAEELWDLPREQAVGRGVLDLGRGLPVATIHPWIEATLAGQEPRRGDVTATDALGRPLRLSVTVTALSRGADPPHGALVVMERRPGDLRSGERGQRRSSPP